VEEVDNNHPEEVTNHQEEATMEPAKEDITIKIKLHLQNHNLKEGATMAKEELVL
jgi:hypothetical protein